MWLEYLVVVTSSGLNLPQGGLELPRALHFSGDVKLGRSHKLSASKHIILTEFNLMQALLIVNSSNLSLHQIFPLHGK